MTRAWIGAGVLLAAAALWLLLAGDPTADDDLSAGGGIDALEREEAEAARRSAPTLESGPAPRGGEAVEDQAATVPVETGPWRFRFAVVSTETAAPLGGVEIATDEGVSLGETEDDGVLEVEVDEREFVFRAGKAGFVPHRGLATSRRDNEVALQPGITIKGRLFDFRTTKPLQGGVIHTFDEDLGFEIASPVTDEEGRFEIHGVRPNHPLTLIAQVEGYVPLRKRENFERPREDYELTIGEGAELEVVVLNEKDKPVPNVEVQLLPPGTPPGIHRGAWEPKDETLEMLDARTPRGRTDAEGRCAFKAVPLQTLLQAIALPTDRHYAWSMPTYAMTTEKAEATIHLSKTSELEVRVADLRGEPFSGIEITLRSGRHVFPIYPRDSVGIGHWSFKGMTPGHYVVEASRRNAPSHREKVELRAAHVEKLDIRIPRGKQILGTVRNKRGEAIWMAKVSWRSYDKTEFVRVKTDTKGDFRIDGLTRPSGILGVVAYDVPTTKWSYERKHVDSVAPGSPRMEITLFDGTRVKGRFPDLPKGSTVYASVVPGRKTDYGELWLDKEKGFLRRGPAAFSPPPMYVFKTKGLPPILHLERSPWASEETRDLGLLAFEAANPLKGRVVDGRKQPLRGIKVEVAEPWSAQYRRTDSAGDFELRNIPVNKKVNIRVSARGYGTREFVMHPTSQYTRQDFEIERAGTVRVLLTDAWNRRVGGVKVWFWERRGGRVPGKPVSVTHKTGSHGALQAQLPAGLYTVRIVHKDVPGPPQWWIQDLRVHPNTIEVLNIKLKDGNMPKELKGH